MICGSKSTASYCRTSYSKGYYDLKVLVAGHCFLYRLDWCQNRFFTSLVVLECPETRNSAVCLATSKEKERNRLECKCNVPLLRAYPVGHFRSEPRTKTAHASDQTCLGPNGPCLGPNPQASDQHTSDQCSMPQSNGAMAQNSRGPLRPKRHILVPLCFGTLFLIVFIILSLSIVVAYYCLPITIYSPLY